MKMSRSRTRLYIWFQSIAVCAWLPSMAMAEPPPNETVEFNRDVRPILAAACFQCHGPDQAKRQAELRLDIKEGAFADRDGSRAIVPGNADRSEIIRRITSTDDDERMPPSDSDLSLSAEQIEVLRRWVDQGAGWQEHWSFIPPKRPSWPKLNDSAWVRNGIDIFVQAKLEQEGLRPSSEADKATLLRRVTLDLTGLPPTIRDVNRFLADESHDAYEKAVDRLLASPGYGERMAAEWLNAARFADTSGYQTDGVRFMSRWRDWVIEAFNRNQPFDQFTVDQIAGDMLAEPTLDQLIATGFNRNHRANSEGGIIPEEYLLEYAVDRVDTTFTVWLGLTMGCARCHEHKFDPFTQEEFYQVLAYFNNVPERGRVIKHGNSPPVIKAPTQRMQERLDALDRKLAAAADVVQNQATELTLAQTRWELSLDASQPIDWSISAGLAAHYTLDGHANDAVKEGQHGTFQGDAASYTAGRIGDAAEFDGEAFIEIAEAPSMSGTDKFSLCAWVLASEEQQGSVLSRIDEKDDTGEIGISIQLNGDKVRVNFGPRWLDDALKIETRRGLTLGQWHHLTMTYDGSQMADGLKIYVDGELQDVNVLLDLFTGSLSATQPIRIGSRIQGGRFRGAIDDVRYYQRELAPGEVQIVACADSIDQIVAIETQQRSIGQAGKIAAYYLEKHAPEVIQAAHHRLAALAEKRQRLEETVDTTMVMQEREVRRDTFVLLRGAYDKPDKQVDPGLPESLPPLPAGAPNDRLGFARWLVSPANPLTARVAVNRFWQMYFGTGIVKTVEDFGSQGQWPSHPALLDYLATRFVESGWNMKAMQKLIVTSATYRQSSHVTPALERRDPENRLLARGPRFRLSAQAIRDSALSVSGLLVDRVGGPSVNPYQPAGLWKEIANVEYTQDSGANLYRRSMYTFWKRTVAPPSMATFDSPGRETCIVRQTRTNTPLQALALLNEVTYVEASRMLAARMMTEGGASPEDRINYGFKLATSRSASTKELKILMKGFSHHQDAYRANVSAAKKLIAVGESTPDKNLDAAQWAAYIATASVILNLDEVITKQ